jgi:hypothetical protein
VEIARKILGPKREEVTSSWRKLHTAGLHDSARRKINYIIRITRSRKFR